MLRRVLAWIGAIVLGATLGAANALATIEYGAHTSFSRYGAWTHSRTAGSAAADPYTRAIVARTGLLALSAREALYFNLAEDENGEPLSEACVYDLIGREFDARWWSVTIYAADRYLVQNDDHAAAVDATRVRSEPDGGWRVRIAPVRGGAPYWLSSRNARRGFSLTLRIYNPGLEFAPSAETLPQIVTVSCAEAQR